MAGSATGWTTPADVVVMLRRRWDTGGYLSRVAAAEPWQAVEVPLRGPTATHLAQRFAEVQDWARQWNAVDLSLVRIEYKALGGRLAGVNQVPARVWIDGFEQLCRLIGMTRQARRFEQLLDETRETEPGLLDWVASHPMRTLRYEGDWQWILGTVTWLNDERHSGLYLRQIAVPGVDTKFIEQHRGLLADLLDAHPHGRPADPAKPRGEFAARYGFRGKPDQIRFRFLGDGGAARLAGFTELTVRAQELMHAPLSVSTVYVVENEITYLAFPGAADAVVILGGGYRVGQTLECLEWLADVDLVYWGDIDTHGFAILNRLRQRFPHTRSILMDRATLLAHREQWVTEPDPTRARLGQLSHDEALLYADLVADRFERSVRLEQERVQFPAVERAVALGGGTRPSPADEASSIVRGL
jgi:hypothetical protein